MKLYLMRHGDAIRGNTAYATRPLSEKGEREADAAGSFLLMTREIPDVIMHSSQFRSRMTSERVMVAVTRQDILLKREDLEEDSSPEDFLASIVSEFGKTDKKVMAVGHNPFISRLASLLLAGSKSYMLEEFKTGTLLVTDSIGSGKMWSLRFYMPSKLLAEFHNSYLNLIAQKTSH